MSTQMIQIPVEEWVAPGRKTIQGYLSASRGPRKKDYGLFGSLIADIVEEQGTALPRYQDLHAIWYDIDLAERPGYQLVGPLLRYKAHRPFDGLSLEHNLHRIEVECVVGERWANGLGAWVTRVQGRCLECASGDGDGQ